MRVPTPRSSCLCLCPALGSQAQTTRTNFTWVLHQQSQVCTTLTKFTWVLRVKGHRFIPPRPTLHGYWVSRVTGLYHHDQLYMGAGDQGSQECTTMTNFIWMLGTRNLVLVLTQQVLYPWSHFSSFCLHVCICSCAGSAHVRGRAVMHVCA